MVAFSKLRREPSRESEGNARPPGDPWADAAAAAAAALAILEFDDAPDFIDIPPSLSLRAMGSLHTSA